jgi:hypothetical protein
MSTSTEAIIAALETRLTVLEQEINRLIRTAPTIIEDKQQQECWQRARDLQREVRSIREQIRMRLEQSQVPSR